MLGGVTPGVDFLPRSHVVLLEALRRLGETDADLVAGVEVHLAGVLTEDDREVGEASPHARLLGYRSHEQTLALIRTADLLFLPMHDLPPGRRAGLVPGKAYEYAASGRPILAAVPDGDVRDILGGAGTARFCRPADVETMAAILRDELLRHRAGVPDRTLDRTAIAPYERRALTARLAGVLDGVAGAAPAAALRHAA